MSRATFEVPRELKVIPRRPPAAHKGDFGRILVVGGCVGMHGAPLLAGKAALASGAADEASRKPCVESGSGRHVARSSAGPATA